MCFLRFSRASAFWLFWLTVVSGVQYNQLNGDGCHGASLRQQAVQHQQQQLLRPPSLLLQREQLAAAATTPFTVTTKTDVPEGRRTGRATARAAIKATTATATIAAMTTRQVVGDVELLPEEEVLLAEAASAPQRDANDGQVHSGARIKNFSNLATATLTAATAVTNKRATNTTTTTRTTATATMPTKTATTLANAKGKHLYNAKNLKLSKNAINSEQRVYDFKANVAAKLFANDAPYARANTTNNISTSSNTSNNHHNNQHNNNNNNNNGRPGNKQDTNDRSALDTPRNKGVDADGDMDGDVEVEVDVDGIVDGDGGADSVADKADNVSADNNDDGQQPLSNAGDKYEYHYEQQQQQQPNAKSSNNNNIGARLAGNSNHSSVPHTNERRHIVPEKLQYTKEIIIKQGRLMGITRNFHPSTGLRDVDQYLGLPYAEAPVGSRRFMPPGASLPWPGLKIARHLPPVCPQQLPDISLQGSAKMSRGRYKLLTRLLPYLRTESEDCLYLNVYVPRAADAVVASVYMVEQPQRLYPVLVYVHGESFEWNSGNAYDGSVLASYGQVIVVTINYRLGVMGFLKPSIDENTVANFGLLDQIAALHWIKENIGSFGGDKDSVTLMGHSTGAACVNYLMISPVAAGLFHRAILMSGSAMSDWAVSNHSLQLTMQIAHALNCPLSDDNEEMLSCLRQKRYQDILKIPTAFPQFSTSLGPIVDGHVIPNQPYKVMGQYTEHFSRYDLLFGVTESESYHTLGALALDEGLRENERDNLLRFYMQTRFDVRPDLALAATLKKYEDMYNNPIKATNLEHRDIVLDILSDARIVGPLMQTGLFHADVNRRNYMYVFGHNSAAGPHASLPHSITGEELAFIFGAPLAPAGHFPSNSYSAQEKLLAEAVMSYWTNFAKTGNPKAPWKGSFINLHGMEWDRYDLDWPEFNKRTQAYINIGIPPSIGYKYRQIYMNFWNKELPDELNQIATIQRQPYLHTQLYGGGGSGGNAGSSTQLPYGGTAVAYPTRRHHGIGSEVITGHMSQFGTRDNGAEDPVRTLKLLLQEPYAYGMSMENAAENMYNAPPTFGVAKQTEEEQLYGSVNTLPTNVVGLLGGSNAIYGVPKSDVAPDDSGTSTANSNSNGNGGDGGTGGSSTDADEEVAKSQTTIQLLIGLIAVFIVLNVIIYSTFLLQRRKKAATMKRKLGGILSYDGATDDELKRCKQHNSGGDGDESYVLDIVRKSNAYESVKTERSPINGYKMTRQLSTSTVDTHTKVCAWMAGATAESKAQLVGHGDSGKCGSKLSSSPTFSSLRSSSAGGSFKQPPAQTAQVGAPHKVSVSVDATPGARSSSVLGQEPIEMLKLKADGRNIIICQEMEVDDQELLTPQSSLDASCRYSLLRQHSTATEACEAELAQYQAQEPLAIAHAHSHSDPVDMLYYSNVCAEEQVTSFMCPDIINVTSRDDDNGLTNITLSPEQQLQLIKSRNYPKVLPTAAGTSAAMADAHPTDSPPMTLDLRTTNKRNSLPPNSFLPHFAAGRQVMPPLPPPRTISTLGRKPSLGARRNSNNITTSPLQLAQDSCAEEDEEPQITQNTLIVGPIVPKLQPRLLMGSSIDSNYSTLKRDTEVKGGDALTAAVADSALSKAQPPQTANGGLLPSVAPSTSVALTQPQALNIGTRVGAPGGYLSLLSAGAAGGVGLKSFESCPVSAQAEDNRLPTLHTHHTEKVYAIHSPSPSQSASSANLPTPTPSTVTPPTLSSVTSAGATTTGTPAAAALIARRDNNSNSGCSDIYAQPMKCAIKANLTATKTEIPHVIAATTATATCTTPTETTTTTTASATAAATRTTTSKAPAPAAIGAIAALGLRPEPTYATMQPRATATATTTAAATPITAPIIANCAISNRLDAAGSDNHQTSASTSASTSATPTATISRIPQLNRNASMRSIAQKQQQQQQQSQQQSTAMTNNAKLHGKPNATDINSTSTTATTATATATNATQSSTTTTSTTPVTTTTTTTTSIAATVASVATTSCRDSCLSSASSASSGSTASSTSSASSSTGSTTASGASLPSSSTSTSSTSSSTGTVRTELQHK